MQNEKESNKQNQESNIKIGQEGSDVQGEDNPIGNGAVRYVVRGSDRVVRDATIKEISLSEREEAGLYSGSPNSIVDDSFVEINDANLFHKSISESKKGNKYAARVFVYPVSEYKTSRLFMTKDGLAGLAITKEGDIISEFSHGLMYFVGKDFSNG